MRIDIDRLRDHDGNLIFNIRVSELHESPFSEEEYEGFSELQNGLDLLQDVYPPDNKYFFELKTAIHGIMSRKFDKVKENLMFAIDNQLKVKFEPICQEIYNSIYDSQQPELRKWMQEFDPQRTKYYFDNDKTIENSEEEEEN